MGEPAGLAKARPTRAGAAMARVMPSAPQADLFGTPSRTGEPPPSDEILALVRARLHATVALVRSAGTMPLTDRLAIIREDNAFHFGKDMLPPAEGSALWAEFDREMDRLYAAMDAENPSAAGR